MDDLIPQDIESFLMELKTFPMDIPGACEAYARVAADLLYDKYFLLHRKSLKVLPENSDFAQA